MTFVIHFYLDDEEETEIASFYDLGSNPFNVGDVVSINIDCIMPKAINQYPEEIQKTFIDKNNKLRENFHLKDIRLVRELKFVSTNVIGDTHLSIDYYCEIINK